MADQGKRRAGGRTSSRHHQTDNNSSANLSHRRSRSSRSDKSSERGQSVHVASSNLRSKKRLQQNIASHSESVLKLSQRSTPRRSAEGRSRSVTSSTPAHSILGVRRHHPPETSPTVSSGSEKRRKVEGGSRVAEESVAGPDVGGANRNQSESEQREYALRSRVRVDARGALIPLFPPSHTDIAIAQGRKPFNPRRASTSAHSNVRTSRKSPTVSIKPHHRESDPGPSTSTSSAQHHHELRVVLRHNVRQSPAGTTGSCVSSNGSGVSRRSQSRAAAAAGKYATASSATATASNSAGAANSWMMASAAGGSDAPGSGPNEMPGPAPRANPTESSTAAGSGIGLAARSGGPAGDLYELTSESDDNNEVGRLQALLESRGLPPHLFGALAPRMQHLLNRSMTVSSTSKAHQLLAGLQASGDESQQLQAVIEMCQMLIMGNEDTLTGFPVKDAVPALITLLTMDHNFVMMNHACRALTYMMEALPRSSAVVVDAVPVFLEKLQEIQCMDVAEQSLTALEALSRRHSKSILMARGVSACLKFLDFFSITAQRAALAVTANCCQNVHQMELCYVADSLPILAARLTRESDKKCVESICLSFCRLVDSFQHDPVRLQEIASTDLLTNLQQLLVESPPIISSITFIGVLRMLTIMCSACPDLQLALLKQNMAETLCYLLTGSTHCASQVEHIELVPRSPQELYEITSLIGELMPRLPTDGVFSVDSLLERAPMGVGISFGLGSSGIASGTSSGVGAVPAPPPPPPSDSTNAGVEWQWRDEHGRWHSYSPWDSRVIEAGHQNRETEVGLNTRFNAFTVNLHAMTQVCEELGSTYPIRRRVTSAGTASHVIDHGTANFGVVISNGNYTNDSRIDGEAQELASTFVRALFSTLYEVYSSSAGPAVRYKCLKALLRMVHFASPDLLKEVLKKEMVSRHIAGMLASHDLRIVVGALQMANILMNKLHEVFGVRFMREGVTHEMKRLATAEPAAVAPDTPQTPSLPVFLNADTGYFGASNHNVINVQSALSLSAVPSPEVVSSPQLKLTEVLSRKRKSKRANLSTTVAASSSTSSASASASGSGHRGRGNSKHSHHSHHANDDGCGGGRSRFASTSFLASLNPARWGRSGSTGGTGSGGTSSGGGGAERGFFKDPQVGTSPSNSNLTAGNKEKVRVWIRETANKFVEMYYSEQLTTADVLSQLTQLIANMQSSCSTSTDLQGGGRTALKDLCDILRKSDISPFEVHHSGLVRAFLDFLTGDDEDRDHRLRIFLNVFADLPTDKGASINTFNSTCLSLLVTKLNSCVSQVEQFPVKVHDLPAGARGGTSALKFFNTHQLKCNLQRHPDCTNLKQWKGGSVKIDPLALVSAIERYLVVRGYGRIRGHESGESDEDNSEDDDIDDTLAAVVISQGTAKHQLQFLIGDNVLPYNMTVYQAVRQFSIQVQGTDASETDTDSEMPLGHSAVWVQTHTILYRAAPPAAGGANNSLPVTRKHKGSSNKTQRKPPDGLWNEGIVPVPRSPLTPYLTPKLPSNVTIQDPSLDVLALLRVLHAISRYWGTLYDRAFTYEPLIAQPAFVNNKIAAKASRQLQDPLVLMTGNLPLWLQQIALACPFLLPFETRQLLFYATSFDRDRALQRLLDASPDLNTSDSSERVTPKLDRRKRTISRTDILKQAEMVMQDLASSRALLEVQYENEVGTGLGPTLEFYALVSRELQRHDLELWSRIGSSSSSISTVETEDGVLYVFAPHGLYPAPLARNTKVTTHAQLNKIRTKFRFIGGLMAKAVMDSRLLDMSFSPLLYRWLLHEESTFSLADLYHLAPHIHKTLVSIFSGETSPDDLCLDFTLPSYPEIELRKGGRDVQVDQANCEQYVRLVVHWMLVEGVVRQMESLREGFECVFPLSGLRVFYPEELDAVFCGSQQQSVWDVKTLSECFRPDHGFTLDSRAIRFLFEVLSSYNGEEQRLFLQFVTGSPRLPVGGFKSLTPPLTVVRKNVEGDNSPDNFLPSVMTCVNYLKLPDYSSVDVMRARLETAAREGSHSFHLS